MIRLNFIYHGTANPGPWDADEMPGDDKWAAGIFARDADTGEARWLYQWRTHDVHDYDCTNENVLLRCNLPHANLPGKLFQVLKSIT